MQREKLLSSCDGRDAVMTTASVEGMQDLTLTRKFRRVCKIVDDDQDTEELLMVLLLHPLDDLMLGVYDLVEGFGVVVVKIDRLVWGIRDLHLFLYVVLDGTPGRIYVYGGAHDIDATEAALVDIQDHVLKKNGLPRARRSYDDAPAGNPRYQVVFGLLALELF